MQAIRSDGSDATDDTRVCFALAWWRTKLLPTRPATSLRAFSNMTEPIPPHPLDAGLQFRVDDSGTLRLATDANYWNMSGPFGGWLLAAGLKAVLTHPQATGGPVEAHARFLAAPKTGELQFRIENQSQGRSVGFWRVSVTQDQARGERLCAEISVILAEERETTVILGARMPEVPPPEAIHSAAIREAPLSWLRRYDFRYLRGAPFKLLPDDLGAARMESILWVSEAQPRTLDWIGLAAFCDIPAPRPFLVQKQPSPVATVSLSLYFHANADEVRQSNGWLLLNITGKSAGRGFFDHAVEIWRADGKLLASSTQLAWFS